MNIRISFFSALLFLLATACSDQGGKEQSTTASGDINQLFELKTAAESGIDFTNQITEDETYNHILIDVIVNGGGVGVVDINNDGLLDVFFSGNMVSDRLYLNEGNLKFKDITESAGIENDAWSTAVTFADVNNDGYQDIYVGRFVRQEPGKLRNALYINNGDLTFTESAGEYGLDHEGHCTTANFFDYDNDGDLDLYVGIEPNVLRHQKYDPTYKADPEASTDRFYRNDGGKFTDVTEVAGLKNFNYTLAATAADVNHDGYTDLYVASDYEEPDYYYINQGNGTFVNNVHDAMRHISNFSMGVDIADFDNDGWADIVVADMAPEDNYRSKANMSGMNPKKFWSLAKGGYHYQYMFNTLQRNNGNSTYSEIGHQAGIAKTDWSWATLLADYDLDGDKDLYITNGQLRDIRNKDYVHEVQHYLDSLQKTSVSGTPVLANGLNVAHLAPQERLANYMFLNEGDWQFTNVNDKMGLPEKTFSQGAVYADLDNDGDLDLLVNNMNDRSFLYENRAAQQTGHHYIQLQLEGEKTGNPLAVGAKAWVFTGDKLQMQEVAPVRGYMSSNDPRLLFGLGTADKIDRLVIQWPGGKVTELKDVSADQSLRLKMSEGEMKPANIYNINAPLFTDATERSQLVYQHLENEYDDYADEVLLPHRMSRLGPAAAKADVNGDGLEDMYLGGAAGTPGRLFLQQADGTLTQAPAQPWSVHAASEDVHAHFFDADGDADMDLYVTSGGNEFPAGDTKLRDRLYTNQGNGSYIYNGSALPDLRTSGGVAIAGDLDGDGDQDLFVGGRQVPGKYGYPAQSYVLRNDGGQFKDVSNEVNTDLASLGMVTDAAWGDIDGDQDEDLVLVGEWMPITIMLNEGGQLTRNVSEPLAKTNGWWNRVQLVDLDGDGDLDAVAGNAGLNIKFDASVEKPFKVYVKDFDENGTNDVYLAYYDQTGAERPIRGRQCSSEQMAFVSEEFPTYHDFASASLEEVLGERLEGAVRHEVYDFRSMVLHNNGQGQFVPTPLPGQAQSFPIFGIVANDFNKDGRTDLLLTGNYYEREVETTRSDAGVGTVLMGQEDGTYEPLPSYETGIYAYLDVRNTLLLSNETKPLLVIVNNNNGAQVYQ